MHMILFALLRRLRVAQDSSGLAMIEFALILPFVLFLGFVGLETANYIAAYMRVSQIAMTVADNAARVRQGIDEADVNELMIGARLMGSSINFAQNGRIILSDLEMRTSLGTAGATTLTPFPADNPNGYRQWIRWQRCSGALSKASSYGGPLDSSGNAVTNLNSAAKDDGAVEDKSALVGMGPAGSQITASSGTAVMFVEVYYQYQPIVPAGLLAGTGLINNLTLHTTEAFNIRQRTDFSIYNSGGLTGNNRSDCLLNSATVPTG
jgi:hypothetical protein